MSDIVVLIILGAIYAVFLILGLLTIRQRRRMCTCNGTLRQSCPQHGWEQAESIGSLSGYIIEILLKQYLNDEARDGAWFERELEFYLPGKRTMPRRTMV